MNPCGFDADTINSGLDYTKVKANLKVLATVQ